MFGSEAVKVPPDAAGDAGLVPPPAREWSAEPPDGLLALDLDWDALAPGSYEQLERIGAWECVIAHAQARQLGLDDTPAELAGYGRYPPTPPASSPHRAPGGGC